MAVGVAQKFSCGQSKYIAQSDYIAHASVMSMAACPAGDGHIPVYGLRMFNSSNNA